MLRVALPLFLVALFSFTACSEDEEETFPNPTEFGNNVLKVGSELYPLGKAIIRTEEQWNDPNKEFVKIACVHPSIDYSSDIQAYLTLRIKPSSNVVLHWQNDSDWEHKMEDDEFTAIVNTGGEGVPSLGLGGEKDNLGFYTTTGSLLITVNGDKVTFLYEDIELVSPGLSPENDVREKCSLMFTLERSSFQNLSDDSQSFDLVSN